MKRKERKKERRGGKEGRKEGRKEDRKEGKEKRPNGSLGPHKYGKEYDASPGKEFFHLEKQKLTKLHPHGGSDG